MHIAFRTDASVQIGTGHVMRCLTLANALSEQGAQCTFVCRAHEGHLGDKITAAGHVVHLLTQPDEKTRPDAETDLYAHWLGVSWQQDAEETRQALKATDYDWLVVDHYGLDARWESPMRDKAKRILAIDDLANRSHDCDLLLDQNLGRKAQDYDDWVPEHAKRLVGPTYALLRPEFAQWREYSLARREQPEFKRLLVTMGGVDKDNVTGQVLDALQECALPNDCRITVVMGPHAPWLEQVKAQAGNFPSDCQVLVNVSNMAQLMADADLAIGAAGSTSWERCCLGVPSLTIVFALNQKDIGIALRQAGCSMMGTAFKKGVFKEQVGRIRNSSDLLEKMSFCSAKVTTGSGTRAITNLIYYSWRA